MAFTRAWNEATPAGSEPANTLDTIIQNMKADIRERMNATLVQDWTTDPILLKDNVVGKADKVHLIHASRFMPSNPSNLNQFQGAGPITGNTTPYYAALALPPGVTLTKIEVGLIPATTIPIFVLARVSILLGGALVNMIAAPDTRPIIPAASAVYGIYSSAIFAHVIDANYFYVLFYSPLSNNNSFTGARVSYSAPSSLNTV